MSGDFANKTSAQIINLTQDVPAHAINLASYTVIFFLSLAVFFGQKGHRLFAAKQNPQRRHLWVVLLNVSLFALYRIVSSGFRIAHKVVRFSRSKETYRDSTGLGETSVVLMVMGFPMFVTMFSNLVGLWTSIVETSHIGSRRTVVVMRVSVIVITVAVFIDSAIASAALCFSYLHPLVEPVIVRYVCGPIFGVLVLSLNIIIIIVGIFLIRGVRAAFEDKKHAKTKAKDMKKLEYRLLVVYKVSFGCLLFLVAVNIQLVGVVLTAVLTRYEIFPALLLIGPPESITMLMILISFWPFGCCCTPSLSARKAAEQREARKSKQVSSARGLTAHQLLRPVQMENLDEDESSSDLSTIHESQKTKEETKEPKDAETPIETPIESANELKTPELEAAASASTPVSEDGITVVPTILDTELVG